jgi:chromosome segregation ATPase
VDVADQCFNLIEAARNELLQGQVQNALAFVQIIRDDGDQLLLALESASVHLEDARKEQRELLNVLTNEKADLAVEEEKFQDTITTHQNDMQHVQWQGEHVECLLQDANQERCRAERAYEESKTERQAIRSWYFIPIIGWIGWSVKNKSCDAKMAAEKRAMDEAAGQLAEAEANRDVVDAVLGEDAKKIIDAKAQLEECEKKKAEHHQLIGDLKLALSMVSRANKAVEDIINLSGLACNCVAMLAEILDICRIRPGVGRSSGTKLQFEYTGKSWKDVKEMVGANEKLLDHRALCK